MDGFFRICSIKKIIRIIGFVHFCLLSDLIWGALKILDWMDTLQRLVEILHKK